MKQFLAKCIFHCVRWVVERALDITLSYDVGYLEEIEDGGHGDLFTVRYGKVPVEVKRVFYRRGKGRREVLYVGRFSVSATHLYSNAYHAERYDVVLRREIDEWRCKRAILTIC